MSHNAVYVWRWWWLADGEAAGGRSKADIDAGGVLAGSPGCSYETATTTSRPPCMPNAGLISYGLKGVYDADPAGQSWAEAMTDTLLVAKDMMARATRAGQAAHEERKLRVEAGGPGFLTEIVRRCGETATKPVQHVA